MLNITFEQDGTRATIVTSADNSVVAMYWKLQGELFLMPEATEETITMTYQLSEDGQSLALTQSSCTINLVRTTFESGLAKQLQSLQEK